ncbi:Acetyl-CoA decarbonylase/synthase complex subunit alpha 1 [Quillaja saponaria]|uniref:Acetyl-CoA decarbonylase/synthase complex subunit alpha 1 n=1 Tax=Quillaja saponaria TaxID=32244 RepID=A0AAD7KP07_QUISA|nr:Acetyl-CoA decarbonylase/synthase complex subunit alpha 1 [Quillaja saponaria]
MGSSLLLSNFPQISSANFVACEKSTKPKKKFQVGCFKTPNNSSWSQPSLPSCGVLHKSVPLAASVAFLLWSSPANAGLMSGFSGIESIPGPQLPQIDFLNRLNEDNQKKYAEFDERFKSSPLLKKLLEQSKLNKEKNRQEVQDKYCIRGAEWGVGDCSAEGMTPQDRENFIAMLKQKAGVK